MDDLINQYGAQTENVPTIDNGANTEYNKTINGGENNGRTAEFRELQELSRAMSDEELSGFQRGSAKIGDELYGRLSNVLQGEVAAVVSSHRDSTGVLRGTGKFKVYSGIDGQAFHDIFEVARTCLQNGELVDLHNVNSSDGEIGYDKCKNFLSENGLSGFSITPDGDLISVFNVNRERGFLRSISEYVRENVKTLDCYASPNQNLMEIYSKVFGFKPASVMDYNMDFDHSNIAANHNSPKIAFMLKTDSDIETKHFGKDQYDEAVNYRNSLIDQNEGITENGSAFSNAKKDGKDTRPKGNTVGAQESNPKGYYHATNEYGTIPPGENLARVVDVPQSMDGETKVSRAARTFMEAEVTPDTMIDDFQKEVEDGTFSYEVKTDKDAVEKAAQTISKSESTQDAYNEWLRSIADGKMTKEKSAVGQMLYSMAARSGDTKTAMKIAADLQIAFTEAGQTAQSARLLKKMTPEGKLYYLQKSASEIKTKTGTAEIPKNLADKLLNAKTETEKPWIQEARQKKQEKINTISAITLKVILIEL